MKELLLVLGFIAGNIILNAQEIFQLKTITNENEPTYLIVVNNNEPVDTLSIGGGHLIDYHIKSEDSISVICYNGDIYTYRQYTLSKETNIWSSDSIVLFGATPSYAINPQKITYGLQDFHTAVKIIDGKRTIMDLQGIRERTALIKN